MVAKADMNQQSPSLPCRTSFAVAPSMKNCGRSKMSCGYTKAISGVLGARRRSARRASYLDSLDGHGLKCGRVLCQCCKTVRWNIWKLLRPLEVGFNVEMRIAVLLVQASAFLADLLHLLPAGIGGLLVRSHCILTWDGATGRIGCCAPCIEVVR